MKKRLDNRLCILCFLCAKLGALCG